MENISTPCFTNTFVCSLASLNFVHVVDLCYALCWFFNGYHIIVAGYHGYRFLHLWKLCVILVPWLWKLMNFGSQSPHCEFCLYSSPDDIFGILDMLNSSPWSWDGICQSLFSLSWCLCLFIITSYIWIVWRKLHHVITFLGIN